MRFLFIILMAGCVSNQKKIEMARAEIDGSNCLIKLEKKLLEHQCRYIDVKRGMDFAYVRCKKVDRERENFWDTWWFKITGSDIEIHSDDIEEVENHTICIDPQFRVEAYPPEKLK